MQSTEIIEDADILPAELLAVLEDVIAAVGADRVTDPVAMRGQCEILTDIVVAAVQAHGPVADEDGDEWSVEAWPVQLFDAPAAVADDPMAHGHYVARVVWGLEGEFYIDLSAAQFAGRLPHTGPVIRTWHGW